MSPQKARALGSAEPKDPTKRAGIGLISTSWHPPRPEGRGGPGDGFLAGRRSRTAFPASARGDAETSRGRAGVSARPLEKRLARRQEGAGGIQSAVMARGAPGPMAGPQGLCRGAGGPGGPPVPRVLVQAQGPAGEAAWGAGPAGGGQARAGQRGASALGGPAGAHSHRGAGARASRSAVGKSAGSPP